jgi:hypothetical protein
MERGQLGIETTPSVVFVFDGLIATLLRPRMHRALINMRQWETALDLWEYNTQVCDYMHLIVANYQMHVDVITWQPKGFADAALDKLWRMDIPVREVRSSSYTFESPHIAVDTSVQSVFDANPEHRHGYGFKGREWDPGVR